MLQNIFTLLHLRIRDVQKSNNFVLDTTALELHQSTLSRAHRPWVNQYALPIASDSINTVSNVSRLLASQKDLQLATAM